MHSDSLKIASKIEDGFYKNIYVSPSVPKEKFKNLKKYSTVFTDMDIFFNEDDSIKIGCNYSMMKGWDRDLLNYSNSKNHLLIPGIKHLEDLKQAIDLNCKIIFSTGTGIIKQINHNFEYFIYYTQFTF